MKESEAFSSFCKSYGQFHAGKVGFSLATALMGTGVGVLSILLGPVGWTGVAMAALTGGSIGGALGAITDHISCKDDQYSFLAYYCYVEFLPRFLGI